MREGAGDDAGTETRCGKEKYEDAEMRMLSREWSGLRGKSKERGDCVKLWWREMTLRIQNLD